jgi:outer membrane protein TolC
MTLVRADALRAADPGQPVPPAATAPGPLELPAITAPADRQQALEAWRRANRAVGEFPRGHIDLLRWEQGAAPASAGVVRTPPATPLSARAALAMSLQLRPDLLDAPTASAQENTRRHQALLAHAQRVQRTWIGAVAARENLTHLQARRDTAQSGADLGQRMVQAGNWSRARLLQEQVALADAHADWLGGQQAALQAQEALARILGQWQPEGLPLPEQLPQVPTALTPPAPSPEAAVLQGDPQLALLREQARRQLTALPAGRQQAWQQALARAANGLPDDGLPARGLTLDDRSLAQDHALEAAVEAEAALLRRASERRSFAREAWARVQAAHALAQHAGNIMLPLREALEQETLLRYNGMLQSTWDLLAASQARIAAAQAASAARRDFWLAWLDWQWLQAGGDYLPTDVGSADARPAANATGDH